MDFHLVHSHSGAGALEAAIDAGKLSGKVFCTGFSPGLGPLDDGRRCAAFLREMAGGYTAEDLLEFRELGLDPDDAFAPLQELQRQLAQERPERLLIWSTVSGADYVLLRMACHWFGGSDAALAQVPVPTHPENGRNSTGAYHPEQLASCMPHTLMLSTLAVERLAQEFRTIAARPEPLRECNAKGELRFRSISTHDKLLLTACTTRWRSAARVIGDAMYRSDRLNDMWDGFLCSRLLYLIATQQVQVDGIPNYVNFNSYRVRLPAKRK
jgi:hypothetical protein